MGLLNRMVLVCLAASMLAACAPTISEMGGNAGDALIAQVSAVDAAGHLGPSDVILATSFVPVGDLAKSSDFGKTLSEVVASSFVQKGYTVHEARMARDFAVTPAGEFVLTREAREMAGETKASHFLVGTYAATSKFAVVNVRLVNAATGTIEAAWSDQVDLSNSERELISPSTPDEP